MSHYTTLPTRIVDEQALALALQDMGFRADHIERSETPLPLVGYRGDVRPERAHVIISRKHISRLANDVGFVRGEDGTYGAIISEYDARRFDAGWLRALHQRYAYHATLSQLAAQGFALAEEQTTDGSLHLTLRRA